MPGRALPFEEAVLFKPARRASKAAGAVQSKDFATKTTKLETSVMEDEEEKEKKP